MIRPLLFAVVSVYFVFVSRKTLFQPASHGFHRLFAWECILALVLLNAPHWLGNPFAADQIVASLLLLLSLGLVVHGLHLLRVVGKPDRGRPDAELLAFEKTTRLVTVGAYRYIRHPMYASLLLLAWGAFCKHPSLPALLLALAASWFLLRTAEQDEAQCLRSFGDEYRRYMAGTKRFIPFLL